MIVEINLHELQLGLYHHNVILILLRLHDI